MEDCLFCKIAAGEIPSNKLYEDDALLAVIGRARKAAIFRSVRLAVESRNRAAPAVAHRRN